MSLKRFVEVNQRLLQEDQILRVRDRQLQSQQDPSGYTIDARVGGDMNEKQQTAQKKPKNESRLQSLIHHLCWSRPRNPGNIDFALSHR